MVHLPLNIKKGEGIELSKRYKVGSYYPLFVLTNSTGKVISRWTGYTGSSRFISSLRKALSDLITVEKRVARHQAKSTYKDALFLAQYNSDTGEHLKAVEYYRQARSLSGSAVFDYSFEIFENTSNATWKDIIPFDEVFPAADAVLTSKIKNRNNIIRVARIMSSLAREKGKTNQIATYLQAGIDATANSQDKKTKESHDLFLADRALYISGDTAEAIRIRKASLGRDWEIDPARFYPFARWCFERRINLEEAEMYTRMAVDRASQGKFKAKLLNLLAEICNARGNTEEAVRLTEMAIDQDPDNEQYRRQLKRFQESLGN